MEVCISGCVFSSLVYELENSRGDVEGLLLGEINSRIVNTVTDSQSENLRHERVATIQGFVPFGKAHRFYTGVGQIVDDTVSEELNNDNGKTVQKVIGWFKFRRNTQSLVSMRERFIHHNLIEKFNFTPAKEFIMAVFTASMSRDMSTHKLDYSFCCSSHRGGMEMYANEVETKEKEKLREIKKLFEPVHVQILNLGDTSHSEYRLNSLSAQATSNLFYEVVDSYRNDFVDDKGCLHQSTNMHGMYITMMRKLQDLVELVKMSETSVSSLTEDVESRKKEVERCRLELASKSESCEVDNRKPVQPHPVPTQSNQDIENDFKTVSKGGSGISTESYRKEDLISFDDNDIMETNNQSDIPDEKTNVQINIETRSLSRRKQKTPARVVSLATADADDDITDDETQTYSLDDNVKGSGPNYEETFSKNLTMESSSPVF